MLRFAAGGWATVGDRGRVAADGTVHVAGRVDAVVTGGATVLVADVESALRCRERRAAWRWSDWPTRSWASSWPRSTPARTTCSALTALARRELPASHRPRRWLHRSELPLTAAGKVDRTALAAWAAAQ